MKNRLLKYLAFLCCTCMVTGAATAQGFSFNCTRDTVVSGCGPTSCFSLQHIIPDIHANTGSYTVNPIPSYSNTCFPVYTSPGGADTSVGFAQDDRYSAVINIGFPFHFYGGVYNQLLTSTNGYISFDASTPGFFSHFGILNDGFGGLSPYSGTPENLPSVLYDKAVIMGPYHDLNPGFTTSPTQKVQYTVSGTAPHRKWILSYYKVPLYTAVLGVCDVLIENTHQIVLYESTGIVEVLIYDKQICNDWNEGRGMVGMQNFNRDQGIMAPGRRASDNPWGSVGMYETWRFVPSAGASLFKRAELYDISGNLVSVGTATNLNNGQLRADFSNICAPTGNSTFIIRSVYSKIDNPAVEIFGSDTIRVTKTASAGLNATAESAATTCGQSNGSVTITVPAGSGVPPYQYSLNGGPLQSGNVFSGLAAGTYTAYVQDAGSCSSTIPVTVAQGSTSIGITTSSTAPTCTGMSNGSITVTATNGTGPFSFVLNGTTTLTGTSSATFTGLTPGSYTVAVTNSAGCSSPVTPVTVEAGISITASVSSTNLLCNGDASGTITVTTPIGGTAPYSYSLDGISWQASNLFTGLAAGNYTVYYREGTGCQNQEPGIIVTEPAALTASASVTQAVCTQNSGSIAVNATGGTTPYQYALNGGAWQNNPAFSNLAAGTYTVAVRDNNGCAYTLPLVTLTAANTLAATTTVTNVTCLSLNSGRIIVNATGGTAPYRYSLNNENWQSSNIFNVTQGNYTVYVSDYSGCRVTLENIAVEFHNTLTLTVPASISICEGSATQLFVNSPASDFSWSPATGLNHAGIANPIANPVTTTQYTVTATLGHCQVTGTVNLVVHPAPVANAGPDIIVCHGQSRQLQGSGGVVYNWYPATYMSGATTASPTITPDRDITYTLSVVDENNCPSLRKDTVKVFARPPFSVKTSPMDTIVHAGDRFRLAATSIATAYSWSPSAGLDNPFSPNPELTVSTDNVLKVTATTAEGCKAEGFVRIRVYKGPDFYIPTGFTPNGDGRNDTFRPFPVGIKQINYFRVFNRAGQLIFSTTTVGQGWDGKFKGADQPGDVYVWMAEGITRDNQVITKKGTITLIR